MRLTYARTSGVAAIFALGLLPLTGCTLDPEAGLASSSPPPVASDSPAQGSDATEPVDSSTTASPGDGGGDSGPASATTADDTGEGTGADVGTLTDIRIGAHDDLDRVVLEFDGPDVPGWHVGYVDEPIGDPSGILVDVAGTSALQVLVEPVGYPEDGANPYRGPQAVSVAGTVEVREAVLSSIFEGELQLFIGVDELRPFRVYGMTDPARVVIEVTTPPLP